MLWIGISFDVLYTGIKVRDTTCRITTPIDDNTYLSFLWNWGMNGITSKVQQVPVHYPQDAAHVLEIDIHLGRLIHLSFDKLLSEINVDFIWITNRRLQSLIFIIFINNDTEH